MGALAALSVMVDGTKPLLSAAEERYAGLVLTILFLTKTVCFFVNSVNNVFPEIA